ncbi:hypothetical protein CPB84DRAFT_1764410 [Gymnopilus junonius]|uniref:Uncharacterized protein n=1 Tax=Gymnopilus junonius TaxID=109634 RepID=A0A9P5NYS2_GYMJU|nr:hypothetical protein CPB84DRAFT_1764410 [Gymnopilus junonius]
MADQQNHHREADGNRANGDGTRLQDVLAGAYLPSACDHLHIAELNWHCYLSSPVFCAVRK